MHHVLRVFKTIYTIFNSCKCKDLYILYLDEEVINTHYTHFSPHPPSLLLLFLPSTVKKRETVTLQYMIIHCHLDFSFFFITVAVFTVSHVTVSVFMDAL